MLPVLASKKSCCFVSYFVFPVYWTYMIIPSSIFCPILMSLIFKATFIEVIINNMIIIIWRILENQNPVKLRDFMLGLLYTVLYVLSSRQVGPRRLWLHLWSSLLRLTTSTLSHWEGRPSPSLCVTRSMTFSLRLGSACMTSVSRKCQQHIYSPVLYCDLWVQY